ncbi:hypothetical protein P691DRAFT_849201 [Macrolepiota fuliginosa MF-IS2]|uniref:NACHT domain-containing protein n=1 Tax=Macrolepiota fuliginosa MF-IS2 TaxID=1400762 RepID=A0A9P5X0B7_9AGAR|nr:hypothetical protein P691DRAFT_849201 [Macrolepiota fuliginosa MF-IS2]
MQGAEFNSSDRAPPPCCHPGTCMTISKKIHNWLENPRPEKKLLWLRGLADARKSTIIQTDPSYKKYITRVKLQDPQSLKKAMGEQFQLLIGEPFGCNVVMMNVWVVMLDGLDECSGDQTTGQHSNNIQHEIVWLISQFVLQHPSAPLIWIIASCPETHLKTTFSKDAIKPSFWEEDIPIDSPEALCGLFIFTEVIIHFIGDLSIGDPIAQLQCVISIISKILSQVPCELLKVVKDLIGTLLFLDCKSTKPAHFDLCHICNSLDIARDNAVTTLHHLHLVLYLPYTGDIGTTHPHFYHTSFQDFLEDPSHNEDNDSEWLAGFVASQIRNTFIGCLTFNIMVQFYSIHVPVPQSYLLLLLRNANH